MKRSAAEQIQHTNTVRLLSYGMVAIFLMALDFRAHYLDYVRQAATHLLIPAYQIVDWPQRKLAELGQSLKLRGQLLDEVETLKQDRQQLQAQLLRYQQLEMENDALRSLLQGAENLPLALVAADVLSITMDPYAHQLFINRGVRAGVDQGMAVSDGVGLLGQIAQSSLTGSMVTLITDADHALPVRNLRNGLRTIAYGSGDLQQLSIRDVSPNADLRIGDQLVTSGLGGRFPEGLLVATIEQRSDIDQGSGLTRFIARPVADMQDAQVVLVVQSPDIASVASTVNEPD